MTTDADEEASAWTGDAEGLFGGDPVAERGSEAPDDLAVWTPDASWSYAELDAVVQGTTARLKTAGVAAGDRVGLYVPRDRKTVALLWALWRTGAAAVPLSTRLPAPEAVRYALRVDASHLVTADPDVAWAADGDIPVHAPDALVPDPSPFSSSEGKADGEIRDDQDATLVFTSGSTGTPKAALHTWKNHVASARGSNANIALRPGDRWLLSLPLYHVGGLAILVRCALAGAAVALPSGKMTSGANASLAHAIRETKATHVSCVATQLQRLLDTDDDAGRLPGIRAMLLGGSAIPNGLLERATERDWPVYTSYGSTEMASQITTTPPDASLQTLRTSGMLLPHRELRIADDGEIQVRGATLFRGYVGPGGIDPGRTGDGWFRTGDRGRIDEQGRLHVLGRIDRMFISGGENVQPEEIETALEAVDGVTRAVVVAVEDDEFGHRPVAFVRLDDPDAPVDAAAIKDELGTRLPRFKFPDVISRLPDEALSQGLKVDWALLEKRARELRR